MLYAFIGTFYNKIGCKPSYSLYNKYKNIYHCIIISSYVQLIISQYLYHWNAYLQCFVVYFTLPQGVSLQFTVSTAEPLQFIPPHDGTGLLQFLVFSLTQETKQFPADQCDHPPLTSQLRKQNKL